MEQKKFISIRIVDATLRQDVEKYLVRCVDNNGKTVCYDNEQFENDFIPVKNSELASTCKLMVSEDYNERFLAEYIQLNNRIKGLQNLLNKWLNNELTFTPTCLRCTYQLQMKAMEDYIAILTMRAKMEGIELPE